MLENAVKQVTPKPIRWVLNTRGLKTTVGWVMATLQVKGQRFMLWPGYRHSSGQARDG
jgi:hypothetical protein